MCVYFVLVQKKGAVKRKVSDSEAASFRHANPAPKAGALELAEQEHPKQSSYLGVHWHKGSGHWQAQVQVAGVQLWLGSSLDQLRAAALYDAALVIVGR